MVSIGQVVLYITPLMLPLMLSGVGACSCNIADYCGVQVAYTTCITHAATAALDPFRDSSESACSSSCDATIQRLFSANCWGSSVQCSSDWVAPSKNANTELIRWSGYNCATPTLCGGPNSSPDSGGEGGGNSNVNVAYYVVGIFLFVGCVAGLAHCKSRKPNQSDPPVTPSTIDLRTYKQRTKTVTAEAQITQERPTAIASLREIKKKVTGKPAAQSDSPLSLPVIEANNAQTRTPLGRYLNGLFSRIEPTRPLAVDEKLATLERMREAGQLTDEQYRAAKDQVVVRELKREGVLSNQDIKLMLSNKRNNASRVDVPISGYVSTSRAASTSAPTYPAPPHPNLYPVPYGSPSMYPYPSYGYPADMDMAWDPSMASNPYPYSLDFDSGGQYELDPFTSLTPLEPVIPDESFTEQPDPYMTQ